MASQWSNESEEFFINEVCKRKYLWDVRDPNYSKKTVKHLGYDEIRIIMSSKWPNQASLFNTEFLKRKFINLKSYYYKKKKLLSSFKSGPGALDVQPKWGHFTKLAFLDDVGEPQEPQESSSYLDIPVKCEVILSEDASEPEEAFQDASEPEEAPEISCMLEENQRMSTSKRNMEPVEYSHKEKKVKPTESVSNQSSNLSQHLNSDKKDLDGEDGYALYITEYMRSMSRKKREKARMKIQQILYHIKYNENSDDE